MTTTSRFLLLLAALTGWASGCSSSGEADAPDSGGSEDARLPPSNDGATKTPDASSEASPADAASEGPTLLQAGKGLTLWGVTGDGYAIYASATIIYAAPLSGGPATSIATISGYYGVEVLGNIAFVANDYQPSTGVSSLTVWSSAGGAHALSMASLFYGIAASSDSRYLTYFDHVDPSGQTGDLHGAKADGTGITLLAPGVVGIQSTCIPQVAFAGSRAVVSSCNSSDAGASTALLSTFSIPAWSRADLARTTYSGFQLDPAGAQALVTSSTGLEVVPLGGGASTSIDATGTAGVFTSDGKSVVYATAAFALRRSTVTAPAPVTLVPDGVAGIYGLSPDGQSVLAYRNYNAQTGASDLYLASAVVPGPLTTLSSVQTAAVATTWGAHGTGFTNDSSHAIYLTDFFAASYPAPSVGTLAATGLDGGLPSTLGQRTFPAVWAWGPSKVIFADDSVTLASTGSTVDVAWVDTAASSPPAVLISQATVGSPFVSAPFYLSPASNALVYTSASGLFMAQLR